MKLVVIRHGDPNYKIDSLTETGWIEAELLSEKLKSMDIKAFYCSPLGRAIDTSRATLEKTGRTAEILPWLCEFKGRIQKPYEEKPSITWNWRPEVWSQTPEYYSRELWHTLPPFAGSNAKEQYDLVCKGLDDLLAQHGYERNGNIYRAVSSNMDTIVLFCHFGVECVILSHLFNVSPMVLWHHTCASPTSVTTLATEERTEGEAIFRMLAFGDTSHLYAGGREPSFAARYGETFEQNEALGFH